MRSSIARIKRVVLFTALCCATTGLSIVLIGCSRAVSAPAGENAADKGPVFHATDYGVATASADNTAALQSAINACQEAGGGAVELPQGRFTVKGTLRLSSNNVWLRGMGRRTTVLYFDNGGADGIIVGNRIPAKPPIAAAELHGNRISDMLMGHGKKTAGRTVAIINHTDFVMEKVLMDHCVVGVYAERINNVILRDVQIIADNAAALDLADVPWSRWVGVYWDTPPSESDRTSRSDVLYFSNVGVQMNNVPGTGVLWDGMCHTLIINYANILHGKYGFRVINSRGDKHLRVPSFLNAFALLIEGAETDLSIEAGTEFKMTSCDFDMCKGHTIQILPDPSGSPTECVQISNSRIGNCQKCALYIDGQDVHLANDQLFTASLAGTNCYPAITIGPHARNVTIDGVQAEEAIGTRRASHAVTLEAGATNIMIDNLNASYVRQSAIEDKGAVHLIVGKVMEPDGSPRAEK
jgi:Pectate lyase superfamily protein